MRISAYVELPYKDSNKTKEKKSILHQKQAKRDRNFHA